MLLGIKSILKEKTIKKQKSKLLYYSYKTIKNDCNFLKLSI